MSNPVLDVGSSSGVLGSHISTRPGYKGTPKWSNPAYTRVRRFGFSFSGYLDVASVVAVFISVPTEATGVFNATAISSYASSDNLVSYS
jgi:hypothetical protein